MKNLISKLLAHKAGIALCVAAVGIVAVAVCATKDSKDYEEAKKALPAEPTKKEVALCFAKNHWRTGIAILSTEALMIFTYRSVLKELAGATCAVAVAVAKRKEIEDYFRKNYPKEYKAFRESLNKENIEKIFSERPDLAKEPEDDRVLYYDPWSCQVFKATQAQMLEAECFINEQMINTGEATLFDYLATFPSSSGLKLDNWMQHFGWYEGDTTYSYNSGYYGGYIKPHIQVQNIIFKGEKLEVNTISWTHDMDLEPDLPTGEIVGIEHALEECYEDVS